MAFVARAFSPSVGVTPYSDLESVEFRDGALVVVIACTVNGDRTVRTVNGLRVTFTQVAGFRVLDELDLARYVASGGALSAATSWKSATAAGRRRRMHSRCST